MSTAFPLGLGFQLGLHADAGPALPTPVRQRCSLAWDINRARAWQLACPWSLRLGQRFQGPYGLRLEGGMRHPYGDLGLHRSALRVPYVLTRQVAARQVSGYAIRQTDPVTQRLRAAWSLLADARLQAVANRPELAWNGRTVRILSASLSCDEGSPVWIAQVAVAAAGDFAVIGIGDGISLALGLETFALVVDGKTLSRESVADQRMELSAVSPVALLDAPFAGSISRSDPGAVSAEAAVESLIGPVDWQLPDWIIPAGRLLLEGVTPLAAARNIVAASGGIVESNPDGTLLCRRRHPVSIPQYGVAAVAHSLFDADLIAVRSWIAPARGYNRVTIANEDGAFGSSSDRIEYVADPDATNQGRVRATLGTARPVILAHTGHPATVIASLGAVSRTEIETVEFIEGRASTRYPVEAISSAVWQHTGLGGVTFDGQTLTAATAGYSLLRITYSTTSLDWRVALSTDEEVQFLLVDA